MNRPKDKVNTLKENLTEKERFEITHAKLYWPPLSRKQQNTPINATLSMSAFSSYSLLAVRTSHC